ncbi:class I SAM-dependent methyltransferase [Phenylobacterium sp.]|uniref:class I SAM-dependent methyltransferase n=1 Tax=Phenylobacterium sp. TaxID=1871053 RepID=UPI003983D548
MSDTANADQIAYWNDKAGQTWASLQAELDRQLEGLGETVMEFLAPAAGERLLDIGCGSGQTTLALARRVGAEGLVLGVDISRALLAAAQRRAAEAGAARARFLEADAQAHPFDPAAFDAAFSRFGVMFFADPPAAFANIRRALKPGGRLAFVCWRTMMENPWMTVPLAAGLAHLPPPEPPTPGAPGPFAFADAGRVRGILEAAGFSQIEIRPHDAMVGGNDLESAVRTALRVGPLGMLMRDNPQARDAVEASVREAIAANMKDGQLQLASATWIVTARNG